MSYRFQDIESATDSLPEITLEDHLRHRRYLYLGDNPDTAGKWWAIMRDDKGSRVKIDLTPALTGE